MAHVTLIRVMQGVEGMCEMLDSSSLDNLYFTCTDLRDVVRNCRKCLRIRGPHADIADLVRAHWSAMTHLHVHNRFLSAADVWQLQQGSWRALHELSFDSASFGKAAITALSLSSWRLVRISFVSSELDEEDVEQLVQFANWTEVQELCLNNSCASLEACKKLPAASLPSLQALNMSNNNFQDSQNSVMVNSSQVTNSLTAANWLATLKSLNLSGCKLTEKAFEQLKQGDLEQLGSLTLSANKITKSCAKHLAALQCPKLTYLELMSCELHDTAVHELIGATWPMLESLDMSGNRLNDQAMRHLVQIPLPKLQMLDLSINNLVGRACQYLGQWHELVSLRLGYSNIKQAWLQVLLKGNWPQLVELHLQGMQARRSLYNVTRNPALNVKPKASANSSQPCKIIPNIPQGSSY